MTNLVRFLWIVPPFILFPIILNAQLYGKITLLADETTYQVSIVPDTNWSPPLSITNSAQITLRANTGTLNPTDLLNYIGMWDLSTVIISPADAPQYDYFSFTLTTPLTNVDYQEGMELVLFDFRNDQPCQPVQLLDNTDDPFLPPNSLNINIGTAFTVLGAGLGVNAYAGNLEPLAQCPPPNPLFMSAVAQDSVVACPGDETTITIQAIQGEAPYDISLLDLSSGDTQTQTVTDFEGTAVFENIGAGAYLFTVTDHNGLEATDTVFIEDPDPVSFNLETSRASCEGAANGQITIRNLHGGTVSADYVYQWSPAVTQTDSVVTGLNPGLYSVTIYDDNGCSATATATVEAETLLFPEPDVQDVSCFGASDGALELFAIGSSDFEYSWWGNGLSGNTPSASGLPQGTYYYAISDMSGFCMHTDSVLIREPEPIAVQFDLTAPDCDNPDGGMVHILQISGAQGAAQFSVNGSVFTKDTDLPIIPGITQTLRVRDELGCETTETLFVPPYQAPQVSLGGQTTIQLGESVQLRPIIFPTENLSISWSPAEFLSCADCPEPLATPEETMHFFVEVRDSSGCQATASTLVIVETNRLLYLPNAFSPNGDGRNDYFTVYAGSGVRAVHAFRIFDRWGNLVFQADKDFLPNIEHLGWDGFIRGKQGKEGTYIYHLVVEYMDGIRENVSGEINLLR